MKIRLIAALPACLLAALAQAQAPAPRPDPTDPGARVPAQSYRSPFADYKPLGETTVGDWRAANDEVGRIGGWRAYAREAQAPSPAPTAPGGTAAVGDHAGHGSAGRGDSGHSGQSGHSGHSGHGATPRRHGHHGHHGQQGTHGGKP